jgi:uncharacterized protein
MTLNENWLVENDQQFILKIYAQPGAKQTGIAGTFGDPARLKIKIHAPPVEGAANRELIEFLAKILKMSKSQIDLIRGQNSRLKDFSLEKSGHAYSEIVKLLKI